MLTTSDLLRLPWDDSLALAGIEYARKSLHYTYDRMRLEPAARLRKIVAGVAVELAFQRWLDARRVPYDRRGATPFTEPDRYDLRLGGRRCDLKSFLVSDRRKIERLRADAGWLLPAEALVPEDQFQRSRLEANDVYLFGFLAGLETRDSAEVRKAQRAGQPLHLLYTPTQPRWLGGRQWRSLGRLALKSDNAQPVEVEIGGQDRERKEIRERLVLPPRARVETQAEFYAWLYLHAPGGAPAGVVGVRSPALKETQLIAPVEWANIWLYGMGLVVAGWLTRAEFSAQAARLPAGSRVRLYPRTQTANRAVLVRDLRPVEELARRARQAGGGAV